MTISPSSLRSQALVQALKQESTDVFAELVESVTLTGALVGEALGKHEAALGSRVEGQVHGLQQEVATLRWKSEELSRLAGMQDDICFLKVAGETQRASFELLRTGKRLTTAIHFCVIRSQEFPGHGAAG